MFFLSKNSQYDAQNVFFKGIDPRFKFIVEVDIGTHVRVSPILDCSVMNGTRTEPFNVARSVHRYDSGLYPSVEEWNKVSYKDLKDGRAHQVDSYGCKYVAFANSVEELDRIWDECVKNWVAKHPDVKAPIFVFSKRSPNGCSYVENWTIPCHRVMYTGMVREEIGNSLHTQEFLRDATDEKEFYRSIRELIAHYKKIFTPKALDEIVKVFQTTYNATEQARRDGINGRMNKLLELQKGDKPLPPPPTTNEWWQGLTEEEKESIRTKATKGAKKPAKGVKKPAKK